MDIVRKQGRITSADLQKAAAISRATALRDLEALVAKHVLRRVGARRGTHYILTKQSPGK